MKDKLITKTHFSGIPLLIKQSRNICLVILIFIGMVSCKCGKYIDFEDLTISTKYNVGDVFISNNIMIKVLPFEWGNGDWTHDGYCEVIDRGFAGSGNELWVNNVNLGFYCDKLPVRTELAFGEYGGNLNIQVNQTFKNFQDFHDIYGQTYSGVHIAGTNGLGNDKGTLKLNGMMGLFDFMEEGKFYLVIGGQELAIDNIKLNY